MTITVQAIRFTTDVPRMRAFLEHIGLAAALTANDSWAVMRSASGDVLLHSVATAAAPVVAGQTELTMSSDDLDALAARLDAPVIDEAYGRRIELVTPDGRALGVDAEQTDLHGYVAGTAEPDPAIGVVPVVFTDPNGPYAAFLTALGLRDAGGDDTFRTFTAAHGAVGLHVARPGEFERFLLSGDGVGVHLTLSTAADPLALAERLRAVGIAVTVDDSFGVMLEIIDPDGRPLQVHAG